jgi:hypothetical protein
MNGSQGEAVEVIRLRDTPIAFCLNGRECTRAPGLWERHLAAR